MAEKSKESLFSFKRSDINSQIDETKKLIKLCDLYEQQIRFPNYSRLELHLNAVESWKFYYQMNIFDLKLTDLSIIVFNYSKIPFLSFSYIQCPYIVDEEGEIDWDSEPEEPLLLRYDLDEFAYNEYIHPASHLHIGDNNIRFGLKRILNPISFTLLVIRQIYPNTWKIFLTKCDEKSFFHIRKNLFLIPESLYNFERELYLE